MRKYILLAITLSLLACGSIPKQNAFISLYRGMPSSDAISSVTSDSVRDFNINVNSVQTRIVVYTTFAAIYTEPEYGTDKVRSVTKTENYYLVFQNDKLLYHGLLYEFLRHKDKNLNDIAVKLKEYYEY